MSKNYLLDGIATNVELGKNGPRVKDDSGVIEHRNAADDAYVITRGADPVGDNDLVTKGYMKRNGVSRIVTGQIDGNSPPAASGSDSVYICTTAGGSYVLKNLYWDNPNDGGVGVPGWTLMDRPDGTLISVTVDLTGGTDEYLGDHVYEWDNTGGTWVDIGPTIIIPGAMYVKRVSLVFNSAAVVNIGTVVPANSTIKVVDVDVTQVFNGTTESTLAIYVDDTPDVLLVDTIGFDLHKLGLYHVDIRYTDSNPMQLEAHYTADSATQGTAAIEVTYALQ